MQSHRCMTTCCVLEHADHVLQAVACIQLHMVEKGMANLRTCLPLTNFHASPLRSQCAPHRFGHTWLVWWRAWLRSHWWQDCCSSLRGRRLERVRRHQHMPEVWSGIGTKMLTHLHNAGWRREHGPNSEQPVGAGAFVEAQTLSNVACCLVTQLSLLFTTLSVYEACLLIGMDGCTCGRLELTANCLASR
jgi:hypothetical protein